MMSQKPDRILIVGLGSIGRRHARILREFFPDAQIAALRHRQSPSAPPEVDFCVQSIAEALKLEPDFAAICNPATHHLEVALALARNGIHTFVEKPLAESACGIPELLAKCTSSKSVLMTGYNMRYLPSLGYFRDLIQQHRIGRILAVHAEVGQYLPEWRQDVDYRDSVSARTSLGGGALLELSHEIDYLRWTFGEVDWVHAVLLRQSNLEIDVEDMACLILGITTERRETVVATLNMDFVRRDTTRGCTAIGELGSLRWNGLTGTVELCEQGAQNWQTLLVHKSERDESYIAQWQNFFKCMETGLVPSASGRDGLAVLNVVDAARSSAASGCIKHLKTSAP